jgi:hypothetical protein
LLRITNYNFTRRAAKSKAQWRQVKHKNRKAATRLSPLRLLLSLPKVFAARVKAAFTEREPERVKEIPFNIIKKKKNARFR